MVPPVVVNSSTLLVANDTTVILTDEGSNKNSKKRKSHRNNNEQITNSRRGSGGNNNKDNRKIYNININVTGKSKISNLKLFGEDNQNDQTLATAGTNSSDDSSAGTETDSDQE